MLLEAINVLKSDRKQGLLNCVAIDINIDFLRVVILELPKIWVMIP